MECMNALVSDDLIEEAQAQVHRRQKASMFERCPTSTKDIETIVGAISVCINHAIAQAPIT